MSYPPLSLDPDRLRIVHGLGVLDAPPEERFIRVARLAARLFDVDSAAVVLLDRQREVFLSQHGRPMVPRSLDRSFAAHALDEPDCLIVQDATLDLRFHDHPDVTGRTATRFVAARPVRADGGCSLGALCLYDPEPRQLDASEISLLHDLGSMVDAELSVVKTGDTDPLTGLNSRRAFTGIAEYALASGFRNQLASTLLVLRLDLPPGAPAEAESDALLEAATLLRTCFRGSDILARLDDQHFAVLLTGAGPQHMDVPLTRLAGLVAAANVLRQDSWQLSFGVGFTGYSPSDHPDVEALIEGAAAVYDLALGQTA